MEYHVQTKTSNNIARKNAIAKEPEYGLGNMPSVMGNQAFLGIIQRIKITDPEDKTTFTFKQKMAQIAIDLTEQLQEKWQNDFFLSSLIKTILPDVITQFNLNEQIDISLTKTEAMDLILCTISKILELNRDIITAKGEDWALGAFCDQYQKQLNWDFIMAANAYRTEVENQLANLNTTHGMNKKQALGQIRDNKWEEYSTFIMEDEPGYTLAMLNALKTSIESPDLENADGFEQLHNLAVGGVSGMVTGAVNYRMLNDGVTFGIRRGWNTTDAGLGEYQEKRNLYELNKKQFLSESFLNLPSQSSDQTNSNSNFSEKEKMHALVGMYTKLNDNSIIGALRPSLPQNTPTINPTSLSSTSHKVEPDNRIINIFTPKINTKTGLSNNNKRKTNLRIPTKNPFKQNRYSIKQNRQLISIAPMDNIDSAKFPSSTDTDNASETIRLVNTRQPELSTPPSAPPKDVSSQVQNDTNNIIAPQNTPFVLTNKSNSEETTRFLAERVFFSYNMQIQECKNDAEKLHVILEICQTLEQLHLFRDGNIRTVYLMLNHMLRKNGLRPVVLEDPNIIDAHSIGELAAKICDGQTKYASLAQSKQ